jgi:hypothetical protein
VADKKIHANGRVLKKKKHRVDCSKADKLII